MDTLGYVKKYQEELKDSKKYNSIFNIWAFLFSSLYFFYKRLYVHFFIFLYASLVLTYVFTPLLGTDNAYLISLLISHLIAGFVANTHYKKYLHNYIENHKNADLNKVVSYDSISITKFILCIVLSLGFYALYWGYKHWEKYQVTTKDDVSPFIRGWLIHLTAPSLFSKINKSINSNIKLQYLGIGYLISQIGSNFIFISMDKIDNTTYLVILLLLSLILFAVSVWFLVIVQKKINEYNISHNNETVKFTINLREIVIVIIGFVLIGILPNTENNKTTYSFLEEYTEEQQEKIGASVGFIYRHTKGYKEVCQKEGYMMNKYPNDFTQYFSSEIKQLKNNLSKHNYTIEDVENIISSNANSKVYILTTIYSELESIGKLLIISQVAEEQGIPIEDVKWDNKWDNILTFKDICEFLDEAGIEMVKEGENKYFLKANAL